MNWLLFCIIFILCVIFFKYIVKVLYIIIYSLVFIVIWIPVYLLWGVINKNSRDNFYLKSLDKIIKVYDKQIKLTQKKKQTYLQDMTTILTNAKLDYEIIKLKEKQTKFTNDRKKFKRKIKQK